MKLIKLTRSMVAKVDDGDWAELSRFRWQAVKGAKNRTWYARRAVRLGGKLKVVWMHRQITGAAAGKVVDHLNHDTLDNQRENLKVCYQAENLQNRISDKMPASGYHGVSWYEPAGMWVARVSRDKVYHVGYFSSVHDAGQAYNAKLVELARPGEVLRLNFVRDLGYTTEYPAGFQRKVRKSRFRGVRRKSEGCWEGSISWKNKRYLGYFPTEEEAAEWFNGKCEEFGCVGRKNEVPGNRI